jgi:hypothetical protein
LASSKSRRAGKRSHAYKRPKDRPGIKFTGSHHCPRCGKWCYRTRGDAEAVVRQVHPGSVVHYYWCESAGAKWWHYTSMTAAQVKELKDRKAAQETEEETC